MDQTGTLTVKQAISRAKKSAKNGDIAQALQLYEIALEMQPNNQVAKKAHQKLQKSLQNKKPTQGQATDPSQDQIAQLMNLYKSGKMLLLEHSCEALLRKHPKSSAVINLYGMALKVQGKLQEAAQAFERVIKVNPNIAVAYFNYGIVLAEMGKLDEAISNYNKAIKADPGYADAYTNRGNAQFGLQRTAEAINSYSKAIKISPDDAEAYCSRGSVRFWLGEIAEALVDYEAAIKINPHYAKAYFNQGIVYSHLGRLEQAVESYDKALKQAPGLTNALNEKGILLAKLGREEEAVVCFEKILESDPNDERHGVRLQLARLGKGEMPNQTPESYMKHFYRSRSQDWARIRTDGLYRGHELVKEAISSVVNKEGGINVLDLGCGSGSLAGFLSDYANRLDGVDLSPDMLRLAAETKVYDNLEEQDLVQYLKDVPHSYGLVVAAAVLIHFADLETIFSLVRDRLDANGKFVFSVFKAEDGEDGLNEFNMYTHSNSYIQQLAERLGFHIGYQNEEVHESAGAMTVMGAVYLLEKTYG